MASALSLAYSPTKVEQTHITTTDINENSFNTSFQNVETDSNNSSELNSLQFGVGDAFAGSFQTPYMSGMNEPTGASVSQSAVSKLLSPMGIVLLLGATYLFVKKGKL